MSDPLLLGIDICCLTSWNPQMDKYDLSASRKPKCLTIVHGLHLILELDNPAMGNRQFDSLLRSESTQ